MKLLREVVERIDLRRNPWKDFSSREEQKKRQLQIELIKVVVETGRIGALLTKILNRQMT